MPYADPEKQREYRRHYRETHKLAARFYAQENSNRINELRRLRKTHCKNGHLLSETAIITVGLKGRIVRKCGQCKLIERPLYGDALAKKLNYQQTLIEGKKKCRRCERILSLVCFYFSSRSSGEAPYYTSQCKDCHDQTITQHYLKLTPEQKQEKARKNKAARHYQATNYGITPEEYELLIQHQNGVCKICKQPERRVSVRGSAVRLAIDHDHATGKVRALLCSHCNSLLGFAKENPQILQEAIAYLKQHQSCGMET